MNFQGLNILIAGAGISGIAAAKTVAALGAAVTLADRKTAEELQLDLASLAEKGVEFISGSTSSELLQGRDVLLLSPAVPLAMPLAQEALQKHIRIMTEIELAYILAKSPICAVTGTNGKTTTVTLLGLLLQTAYPVEKVGVGGNIGTPLCTEAVRIGAGGYLAAEISSYQLEATEHFKPHIAAILNVTPDHVIRHGSLEVYQQVKEKLFSQQTAEDYLILNYDDTKVRAMAERAKSRVFFFSRRETLLQGAYVKGDMLVLAWQGKEHQLCSVDEVRIKGGHNIENALAASAAAFLAGAAPERIAVVLRQFPGVEHRIEPVAKKGGVMYYNDSKATNTESAIKALDTFPDHIVLIAGGDDKMTDLMPFMKLAAERCDELILVGDATERFRAAALSNGFEAAHIYAAGYSMEKAVQLAHGLASSPQIVLLSPACASFDMYDGYEARGKHFKALVLALED